MTVPSSNGSRPGRGPLRVAGLYATFGLLWIWLSDWALISIGFGADDAFLASTLKGTAYVALTAALLYWLVRREVALAQRSESLLRAVVEGTTDAVFVKDHDGRYLLANEAAARFIGRPVAEVLGRDDRELFEDTDAGRIIANDRSVMAGGKVITFEETITSSGAKRTYHATKAPFRETTGAVVGLIGVSRDITERKAAEDAVRVREARYRALANAIPQIVWTAGPDGAITHVNSKGVEYTGVEVADLTGWSWERVIHADDQSHAVAEWRLALGNGAPRSFEMRIRRTDGEYRWHVARQLPICDSVGAIESWVGTCTDIDDLRKAENALRETEARLREAQRIARLGSWSWEPKTDRVWWSDAEFELFGVDQTTVRPSFEAFLTLLHPDDRAIAVDRVESLKAGANEFANDLRVIRPDDSSIWVHSRARATRDAEGNLVRVEGTDQDVTEKILADLQLRAERDRFDKMIEAVPLAICSFQLAPDGSVTMPFASPRIESIYGHSPAALAQDASGVYSTIHPDDVERVHASISESAQSLMLWRDEYRVQSPLLGEIWVEGCSAPIRLSDGATVWHGYVNDVTARKHMDDALRASERQLRLALEAAGAIAFMWDIKNDSVTRYFSSEPALPVTAERVGTLDDVRARVHSDDLPGFDSRLSACLDGGAEYRNEYRVVRPDGTSAALEEYGYLDLAADGSPMYLTGISIDVTDRVAATDALRLSEERLRVALQGAKGGVWDWDLSSGNVWWSPEVYDLMGGTVGMDTREAPAVELIYKSDRQRVLAAISDAIARRADYHCEFRVHGGKRWLSSHARLFCDAAGHPVRLVGISWDISDRMFVMEALRESEARYRQLVDLLPTAIFVYANDAILYSNPAFLRLIGAQTPEELLGSSPFEIAHPSAHDAIRRRDELMARTGESIPGFEKRVVRRDGRSVPVFSVAAPISGYEEPAILVAVMDLTERERATELLRSVLSSVGDAILTMDERGVIKSANPAALSQFGYHEDELVGQKVNVLMYDPYRDAHDETLANYLRTGEAKVIGIGREVECLRRDGTQFPADLTVTEFSLEGERRFTGVLRDITERKRLQTQFIQAQKLEAVGQLAGGVAHDFNNLLTIINGYCDLLLMSDLPAGDKRRGSLAAIRDAGERAARLTQQLLAFSRKAIIEPKVIDLNELVDDSARLLRRLIGEDIILAVVTAPTPIRVKADPGQLEQVIMNLVVNARDAMPTGGRLTIETSSVAPKDGAPSGLARLSVSDSGHGMSDEVKGKIFEPFFTTKGVGKGTGLGLAVVHGVITQSGGQVAIESSVGVGTTFHVSLPLIKNPTSGATVDSNRLSSDGAETVLLVEDEEAVRKITRISLQVQGYTVLDADGGAAAIRHAQIHPGEIHLLISDVVMPEMGGRQLLDAVRQYRPGLQVLFMSGYTDDAVLLHGVVEATDAFIQKPFTPVTLARKVREILDAPAK